jgi:hypothetical protein
MHADAPSIPEDTLIPEFPSWIILPLFVMATLAVVIYKNRLKKKS